MQPVDLIIINAGQLLTLEGPQHARAGEEMNDLNAIADAAVAIRDGRIVAVGATDELRRSFEAQDTLDAQGRLVMPGFVDPHTHLVFAGSREHEMARRAAGETYLDILKSGGGINSTVRATRKCDKEELFDLAMERLDLAAMHGTTSVEIKSGYGLDPDAESKMLAVINELSDEHVLDVVPTFLGAHIVPFDWQRGDYINWLLDEGLPKFAGEAQFCDVFCEEEAYSLEEMIHILRRAKDLGYELKAHVGQFHAMGAAGAAADLGAVSVEHLDHVDDDELLRMKNAGTIGILLPGASFFTGGRHYPDAQRMLENGVPISLATDFNPGSCPSFSMQMMIALACIEMKMTAAQAICAATINAAYSIGLGDKVGSLQTGKQGDVILLNVETPEQLPYYFGVNLVSTVIKNGQVIYEAH
jgi:imidazolonepropionase